MLRPDSWIALARFLALVAVPGVWLGLPALGAPPTAFERCLEENTAVLLTNQFGWPHYPVNIGARVSLRLSSWPTEREAIFLGRMVTKSGESKLVTFYDPTSKTLIQTPIEGVRFSTAVGTGIPDSNLAKILITTVQEGPNCGLFAVCSCTLECIETGMARRHGGLELGTESAYWEHIERLWETTKSEDEYLKVVSDSANSIGMNVWKIPDSPSFKKNLIGAVERGLRVLLIYDVGTQARTSDVMLSQPGVGPPFRSPDEGSLISQFMPLRAGEKPLLEPNGARVTHAVYIQAVFRDIDGTEKFLISDSNHINPVIWSIDDAVASQTTAHLRPFVFYK